jgi:hypothetical protein
VTGDRERAGRRRRCCGTGHCAQHGGALQGKDAKQARRVRIAVPGGGRTRNAWIGGRPNGVARGLTGSDRGGLDRGGLDGAALRRVNCRKRRPFPHSQAVV